MDEGGLSGNIMSPGGRARREAEKWVDKIGAQGPPPSCGGGGRERTSFGPPLPIPLVPPSTRGRERECLIFVGRVLQASLLGHGGMRKGDWCPSRQFQLFLGLCCGLALGLLFLLASSTESLRLVIPETSFASSPAAHPSSSQAQHGLLALVPFTPPKAKNHSCSGLLGQRQNEGERVESTKWPEHHQLLQVLCSGRSVRLPGSLPAPSATFLQSLWLRDLILGGARLRTYQLKSGFHCHNTAVGKQRTSEYR